MYTHFQDDSDDEGKATLADGAGRAPLLKAVKFPSRPHIRFMPTPEMAHLLLIKACTMQHPDLDTTLFEGSNTKKK